MSRSIHWTYKIFKNKSKREIIEMCDIDNPDYAVTELRKKIKIKRNVKEKRAEEKYRKKLKNTMNNKNEVLFVFPINGYGWEENGKSIVPPDHFHIELKNEKEAVVIEKNHIFNDLRIQLTKRHVDKMNFNNSVADFYIEILSKNSEVFVSGYGIIGKEELVLNWVKEAFTK